jgi:hypothetical protein
VIGKNVRRLHGWNRKADRGQAREISKQLSHVTIVTVSNVHSLRAISRSVLHQQEVTLSSSVHLLVGVFPE